MMQILGHFGGIVGAFLRDTVELKGTEGLFETRRGICHLFSLVWGFNTF